MPIFMRKVLHICTGKIPLLAWDACSHIWMAILIVKMDKVSLFAWVPILTEYWAPGCLGI